MVSSRMKYEEDLIRQGHEESPEALEEELLRLRQQKATQEPLLQAMEKTNNSLSELV